MISMSVKSQGKCIYKITVIKYFKLAFNCSIPDKHI